MWRGAPLPTVEDMLTRRALLALPLAAVATTAACAPDGSQPEPPDDGPHPRCVDKTSLARVGKVGRAQLVYELTQQPASFYCNRRFGSQLGEWLADWNARSRLQRPSHLWSYGMFVDGGDGCSSWHADGRAFDISRLRRNGKTIVSCRTDLWASAGVDRAVLERRYWKLAASLHLHFAYVLTYHFDERHENHIHVDNSVSGKGMSRFDTASRVQNQAVAAISTHLWGLPTPVTGAWDDATRDASRQVLRRLDVRPDLRRQDSWQAFLRASIAR